MAVGGYCCAVYAVDMFHEVAYFVAELPGQAVACRVGYVYNGCTGFYYSLYNACQILVVGAACIFGVKLYVLDKALCIFYAGYGAFKYLLAS